MTDVPDVTPLAALMGDPTRGRMLSTLMDGRARTGTELALEGGVSPSTASSHLGRLHAGGLIDVARQGRHRYYRIATPEAAATIEALMGLAARTGASLPSRRAGNAAVRRARVCYDHLAGEVAVCFLDRLKQSQLVDGDEKALELTGNGASWCAEVGIDLRCLHATRRLLCRPCLDWSERRMHLAGALGATMLTRLFELKYARRVSGGRAVILSREGEAFIEHLELPRRLSGRR